MFAETKIIRNGFHVVSNEGEVPWRLYTLLGGSMTRGSEKTIGEFGSGSKYAVELMLRKGVHPIIYSGLTKIEFFTNKELIKDAVSEKEFDVISMSVSVPSEKLSTNTQVVPTAMSLQHGVQEWNNIHMAIREVVANALDMQQRFKGNYRIGIDKVQDINEIVPEEGITKVIIPMTPEINQYFRDLDSHFLHFSEDHDPETELFENKFNENETLIFRMGVRGATIKKRSLYCYNSKLFKLTESRTINENEAAAEAARVLGYCNDYNAWYRLLKGVHEDHKLELICNRSSTEHKSYFETGLPIGSYGPERAFGIEEKNVFKRIGETILRAFHDAFGQEAILVEGNASAAKAEKRGYTPIDMPYSYYAYLKHFVPCAAKKFNSPEDKYDNLCVPDLAVREYFDAFWDSLKEIGFIGDQEKPVIKVATKVGDKQIKCTYDRGLQAIVLDDDVSNGVNDLTKKCLIHGVVSYVSDSFEYDKTYMDLCLKLMNTSSIAF